MVHTSRHEDLPKFIVSEEIIDPPVEIMGNVHRKVKKTWFLNIDLIDASQYPRRLSIHSCISQIY
jgi:hypothetical protein